MNCNKFHKNFVGFALKLIKSQQYERTFYYKNYKPIKNFNNPFNIIERPFTLHHTQFKKYDPVLAMKVVPKKVPKNIIINLIDENGKYIIKVKYFNL